MICELQCFDFGSALGMPVSCQMHCSCHAALAMTRPCLCGGDQPASRCRTGGGTVAVAAVAAAAAAASEGRQQRHQQRQCVTGSSDNNSRPSGLIVPFVVGASTPAHVLPGDRWSSRCCGRLDSVVSITLCVWPRPTQQNANVSTLAVMFAKAGSDVREGSGERGRHSQLVAAIVCSRRQVSSVYRSYTRLPWSWTRAMLQS